MCNKWPTSCSKLERIFYHERKHVYSWMILRQLAWPRLTWIEPTNEIIANRNSWTPGYFNFWFAKIIHLTETLLPLYNAHLKFFVLSAHSQNMATIQFGQGLEENLEAYISNLPQNKVWIHWSQRLKKIFFYEKTYLGKGVPAERLSNEKL